MPWIEEWTSVLGPTITWQTAYPLVADAVRRGLEDWQGDPPTTFELVEKLWPKAECGKNEVTMRFRLFRALRAIAEHDLVGWRFSRGEKMQYMGKEVTLWRWRKPPETPDALIQRGEALIRQGDALRQQGESWVVRGQALQKEAKGE